LLSATTQDPLSNVTTFFSTTHQRSPPRRLGTRSARRQALLCVMLRSYGSRLSIAHSATA